MHAMIAISLLVEGGAVLSGFIFIFTGSEGIAVARAVSYGICAALVSVGVISFLSDRGVSLQQVWNWPAGAASRVAVGESWWRGDGSRKDLLLRLLPVGITGGLLLGLFALGYVEVLRHIPASAEMIRKSQELLAKIPGWRISYIVMGVVFAPFAEEYLFRGLLFRALDREWGGWRAMVGSAAFFAIYHHPLSWLPVALLGITNALLFKKSGRLAPAVILHMVYNAVVLT
jgi:membrane protease YdiL (CAAX protease family)